MKMHKIGQLACKLNQIQEIKKDQLEKFKNKKMSVSFIRNLDILTEEVVKGAKAVKEITNLKI